MTDLGRDLVLAAGGYVALLLLVGALARRALRERTLSDFYLAGRRLGLMVLLLTLFATQYSGNSLSGFPGQTYRQGLAYFMSVTFMVAIVAGYTLFVPSLFARSRRGSFVTPTDFLARRFGSPLLNYLSATIFVVTLFNYLLAQLMAMGHAFAGLTNGAVPFATAVLVGAVVILVYELLGGMRAVAWTDVLQGGLLFSGLLLVVVLLSFEVGSPADVIASVEAVAPEKVASPDLSMCLVWASNFLLLGLGAPLYPQAIQRIYAARSMVTLRRALSGMAFLPLIAITTVVWIGLAGIALFPGLEGAETDQITFRVLAYLVEAQPLAYLPVLAVMMAVVAAIMSTADSCLLSLSSIFTKDFLARARGLDNAEAERLLRWGPWFSIAVMALLVGVALAPRITLWGLLVIKFEILIQMSPAFVLGTLHEADDRRAYSARDILLGLTLGLGLAVTLYALGLRNVGGIHAGVLGVVVNYLTAVGSRTLRLQRAA
ncbi:MAG: sodium:solute symporter family protein [Acidobacteriota bacterium]